MNRLAIIVPYRNREEHLEKFVPHMHAFLEDKNIDYQILVVEQNDDKPFNKGKILNIGFDFFKNEAEYFCFHDVDLLPVSNQCDYGEIQGVSKISQFVSQFEFKPRPIWEFGGVVIIDKNNFIDINGYSNEYNGWGLEDDDFGQRCRIKNIPVEKREGRYVSLYHKPMGDTFGAAPSDFVINNRRHYNNLLKTNKFFDSGLTTLKYVTSEKIDFKTYRMIRVEI
jgi:hypothetical protein